MVQVGEIAYHVQGDVGGIGISRFRFTRNDASPVTQADVNAAAAAVHGFYTALVGSLPQQIQLACVSIANTYDSDSGLVQGPITVGTLPGVVSGSLSGNYAAGTGARCNWHTATVHGRRLMRGCTYVVPLASGAYQSTGALGGGTVTAVSSAGAGYIAAMTTASLNPVVWHRPAKGATSGGTVGTITAAACGPTVSGLRSRRS